MPVAPQLVGEPRECHACSCTPHILIQSGLLPEVAQYALHELPYPRALGTSRLDALGCLYRPTPLRALPISTIISGSHDSSCPMGTRKTPRSASRVRTLSTIVRSSPLNASLPRSLNVPLHCKPLPIFS